MPKPLLDLTTRLWRTYQLNQLTITRLGPKKWVLKGREKKMLFEAEVENNMIGRIFTTVGIDLNVPIESQDLGDG